MQRRAFLAGTSAAVPLLAGCLGEDANFEILNETGEEHHVLFRIEGASTGEVIVDREVAVSANDEEAYDSLIEAPPDGGVRVWADTQTHNESAVVFDGYTSGYRIDIMIEGPEIVIRAVQP